MIEPGKGIYWRFQDAKEWHLAYPTRLPNGLIQMSTYLGAGNGIVVSEKDIEVKTV